MCEMRRGDDWGVREMLCEMIEWAIVDATISTVYVDPYRQKEAEKDREDALAWINGEKETPITFLEVCEALGLEVEIFKEKSRTKNETSIHKSKQVHL